MGTGMPEEFVRYVERDGLPYLNMFYGKAWHLVPIRSYPLNLPQALARNCRLTILAACELAVEKDRASRCETQQRSE